MGRSDGDGGTDEEPADHDAKGASPGAQGGEERWSGAHADHVGEDRKTEDAQDLRQAESVVVRREGESGEQDGGRAEREAADAHGPQGAADRQDHGEEQEGLLGGQIGPALQDLADVHRVIVVLAGCQRLHGVGDECHVAQVVELSSSKYS